MEDFDYVTAVAWAVAGGVLYLAAAILCHLISGEDSKEE